MNNEPTRRGEVTPRSALSHALVGSNPYDQAADVLERLAKIGWTVAPAPGSDPTPTDDGLRERVLALRTEMVGLQAAGAPLVARSWVVHKIDAVLDATTDTPED